MNNNKAVRNVIDAGSGYVVYPSGTAASTLAKATVRARQESKTERDGWARVERCSDNAILQHVFMGRITAR